MAKPVVLSSIIPDADALLELEPEELAGAVLEVLLSRATSNHNGRVHLYNDGVGMVHNFAKHDECARAVSEAWAMLIGLGFLAVDPGQHGSSDWYFITRRGTRIKSREDFRSFQHASMFPRDMMHSAIAERCYALFVRGEYENAVFQAFRGVEVAVREVCGDTVERGQYGMSLMRTAFHPETGPLRDGNEPIAEREALSNLFAGAIGRFKNPSSHRHVELDSPAETIEMLQFASHLLRVVDGRRKHLNQEG